MSHYKFTAECYDKNILKTGQHLVWQIYGWRFGVAVTAFGVSTKLLYVERGYYWDGDRLREGIPLRYVTRPS